MVKNEEKIGVVLSLGMNGEGVIKDEDTVVFVPFALVGEKLDIKYLRLLKSVLMVNF